MKYTKNIGIKLKLMGFESYNAMPLGSIAYARSLHIDNWIKGSISIDTDHIKKTVDVHVSIDKGVPIKSLTQLEQLDKLINQ